MQRLTRAGLLLSLLCGLALTAQGHVARAALGLQMPTASTSGYRGGLAGLRPELPQQEMTACVACRLAARTTGQLPPEALSMRAATLADGVALWVRGRDEAAREVLWKATIARGELLSALRSGGAIHLCDACRTGLERMAELRIDARRTRDGIELVYTSNDVRVVHDLHAVAKELQRTTTF
jgi:hypothetical protein